MQSHRHLEDVLLEWPGRAATDVPVDLLPDEQVLALRDQQMSEDQQRELGDLLARQREGSLDGVERRRLNELMGIYRRGMAEGAGPEGGRGPRLATAAGLSSGAWRAVRFPPRRIAASARRHGTGVGTASARSIWSWLAWRSSISSRSPKVDSSVLGAASDEHGGAVEGDGRCGQGCAPVLLQIFPQALVVADMSVCNTEGVCNTPLRMPVRSPTKG
jgi:hypothetical protein